MIWFGLVGFYAYQYVYLMLNPLYAYILNI